MTNQHSGGILSREQNEMMALKLNMDGEETEAGAGVPPWAAPLWVSRPTPRHGYHHSAAHARCRRYSAAGGFGFLLPCEAVATEQEISILHQSAAMAVAMGVVEDVPSRKMEC